MRLARGQVVVLADKPALIDGWSAVLVAPLLDLCPFSGALQVGHSPDTLAR